MIATANGHELTRCVLRIPNVGPWWAECDFVDAADRAQGLVELRLGELTLFGTVDIGGKLGVRSARIVAGANGWRDMLEPRAYHNDAGVPRRMIAEDAANECGETIGTFEPTSRLASHYVRRAGSAAKALEFVAGGTPWFVDFGGVTHCAQRTGATRVLDVLTYNPREQWATLDVSELDQITIGDSVQDRTGRLTETLTVRDIEVTIEPESLTVRVWHGEPAQRAPLARTIEAIIKHDTRMLGSYTYRVIRMSGDRVDLQAVRRDIGIPDLPNVAVWAGVPGAHPTLTPGAEVLVSFRDGDPRSPVVTHFTGKGGLGFVPAGLDLCGNGAGLPMARQGDLVISGGIGTVVTLWPLTGSPAPPNAAVVAGLPHMISFDAIVPTPALAAPLIGAVSSGSSLLRGG